jgi:hypothetical protein
MSRRVTRSSSRESAVPPTVDLLVQEEENQHEQELSEFDESIQSEFEDEYDTDFDKWADEEENQSSASDDENTIMGSFDGEAEPNLLSQNPLQILSDVAVLTANNYGRIDFVEFPDSETWKNEPISVDPISEIQNAGPRNIPDEAKSPYDFFKLLFTEEMMNDLCDFTNSYAEQWKSSDESMRHDPLHPAPNKFKAPPKWLIEDKKWKELTVPELKQFIAMQFCMAFVKLSRLKDYWSRKRYFFSVDHSFKLMPKWRFAQIKSCFHLCDFLETFRTHGNDPLWKVRDFLDSFEENCREFYVPSSDLALDEMMLRFSGRSSLAFTQQPKPTPNGLKMIAVVDSKNAYFLSGQLDTRSGSSKQQIILDLVSGKNLESRTIVMDRGYVTLGLVESLVNSGFHAVGTIKKYSNIPKQIRNIPKFKESSRTRRQRDRDSNEVEEEESDDDTTEAQDEITEEKKDEVAEEVDVLDRGLKKGEWIWLANVKIPAILVAWHDSGICLAISTRHGVDGSTVQRKAKGHVEKIIRTCPELIKYYNEKMGGVDRADSLRAHLTTIRRCRKWWHSVWYWILDTALINSKILHDESFPENKVADRADFLHSIVEGLFIDAGVESHSKTRTPHYLVKPPRENDAERARSGVCVSCNTGRVVTKCDKCQRYIHDHCFKRFHEEQDRDAVPPRKRGRA